MLTAALLFGGTGTAAAAFPGRDGQLAIQPISGPGLVIASDTGAGAHRICTNEAVCGEPGRPAWSPDGRELVYAADRAGAGSTRGVKIIDATGDCVECLYGSAASPSFEPAGGALSFITGDRLAEDGVDGFRTRTVALRRGTGWAVWSADGDLATTSDGQIVVRSRSGTTRMLGRGSAPDWSPDGRQLAVVRAGWIWVISATSGHGRRLIRGSDPAFSPDGRRVAFIGSGHRVQTISVHGGHSHRLGDLRGRSVAWAPVPSTAPSCPAPTGGVVQAAPDLVYTVTRRLPPRNYGPVDASDESVLSCVSSQGFPRLLSTTLNGTYDHDDMPDQEEETSVIAAGNFVLVEGQSEAGGSAVTLLSALTNQTFPDLVADLPEVNCGPAAMEGIDPSDPDVTPAAGCGVNGLELSRADGSVAELTTGYAEYPACGSDDTTTGLTYDCWTQAITVITTTGVAHTLAATVGNTLTDQSGLTDLSASGTTLTWRDDGTPKSAPF